MSAEGFIKTAPFVPESVNFHGGKREASQRGHGVTVGDGILGPLHGLGEEEAGLEGSLGGA